MNIALVLSENYKDRQWLLIGNTYEGLEWLDTTPKPTKAKLESEWASVQAKVEAKKQAEIDAKASAIAKLQALGLTVTEVEAAFGLAE